MCSIALRPFWAEIDLDRLAGNIRQIRDYVGEGVEIMAVVKADAYGIGCAGIMETLLENGISRLGVGIFDEGLQLRKSGVELPILVFGYTPFEYSELLVENDLAQTVYCVEQAEALSAAAERLNRRARIHIKLDTGMGRLGFPPTGESIRAVRTIAALPGLEVEGIYTHCPFTNERGGEGAAFTGRQFREFRRFVATLERKGLFIPLQHVCNSLGLINYPEMHLNMVRAGIILYGCSYPYLQNLLPVQPVLSLKARIGFVKKVGPGRNISYGGLFTTRKDTIVATLPLGYGDGYSRLLSNKAAVLVNGRRAPVIGTICMDQCMIDVSNVPGEVKIGDEAVLLGRQGEEEISIEELSELICGFINYEYMVLLARRVPRVYRRGGKIVRAVNYLLGD